MTGLLQTATVAVFLALVIAEPWRGSAAARQLAPTAAAQPAPPPSGERADLDALFRIKQEGLERSQVMDTVWHLSEVHGPRLTNSPNIRAAAAWTIKRLGEWNIGIVRQETWGPFGRGWVNERFTANVLTPTPSPLLAAPRAWTPGTDGVVSGDVVLAVIDRADDFKRWQGTLKGKIVLAQNPVTIQPLMTPLGERYTDQALRDLEAQTVTAPRGAGPNTAPSPTAATAPTTVQKMEFYFREGALAVLEPGTGRSDHGTIVVQGSNANRDAKQAPVAAQVVVSSEQYNRLVRLVRGKIPVRVELNVANRFVDDTLDAFNIVAEIPGSDRADEVVMLGAHFDSWHSGTGATDNAAGSAAMMEAMRILKASGVPLRRTVRLALWTGEEQGLLGSRAYVQEHFGDRDTMALKPAHAKLSAYFNMDNGAGAIRGVFLQGHEAIRPVFAAWMEPFRNLGMTTLTIRNTGSTDHVAFDEVGLPGFQFIQDPLEYGRHSHHSNMDVYDRVQPADMMKNATIIAGFVYHAANRDQLLPRKPLPRPRTAGRGAAQ